MNAIRKVVFVLVCSLAAVAADDKVLPMEKGDAWTYTATVRWTPLNSRRARSAEVTWKSEVVNTVDRADVHAALLKGFVGDLAYWDPDSSQQRDWLVVRWAERYYMLHDRDATETFRELDKLPAGAAISPQLQNVLEENIFFAMPLKVGGKYCAPSQPPRNDTGYCWYVEYSRLPALKLVGVAAKRYREFGIAYRTLPEHEVLGLVPGVGIVSYQFAHHGTIATADARLVRVEHAAK